MTGAVLNHEVWPGMASAPEAARAAQYWSVTIQYTVDVYTPSAAVLSSSSQQPVRTLFWVHQLILITAPVLGPTPVLPLLGNGSRG
jgi:hypothetical protein